MNAIHKVRRQVDRSAPEIAAAGLSFSEVCRIVGREFPYVRNLQQLLGLHIPRKETGYSQGYAVFLEKVVALRALHIPQEEIKELFDTEVKVLRLLHVDTLSESPTWYLDACNGDDNEPAPDRLLLCGYRLGFAIDAEVVQPTLDFGKREGELFHGQEMGEDVRRVLDGYLVRLSGVRARIEKERPVVENALLWARRFLTQAERRGRG